MLNAELKTSEISPFSIHYSAFRIHRSASPPSRCQSRFRGKRITLDEVTKQIVSVHGAIANLLSLKRRGNRSQKCRCLQRSSRGKN
jgi:hypothetical protein